MNARTSLLEQKRLQWAKEREEMTLLTGNWAPLTRNFLVRPTARKETQEQKCSLDQRLESVVKVKNSSKSNNDNNNDVLDNYDKMRESYAQQDSSCLPPICKKDFSTFREHPWQVQEIEINKRHKDSLQKNYGSPGEEREGETSGYASDSMDAPRERMWMNPSYEKDDSSSILSRSLSENRARWDSIWGQDSVRGDPPQAPSWLSRLSQSSQVLVINHESASSPDSSSTGSSASTGLTKNYLRGQCLPIEPSVLREREVKRLKALELQSAIKLQLEEKDRQKKEEKARRLKEEQLEEERIKRERELEKARFEEEQRLLKEKEEIKARKAEAMRQVLLLAEDSAKMEKKNRRKRMNAKDELTERFNEETKIADIISTNKDSRDIKKVEEIDKVAEKQDKKSIKEEELPMRSEEDSKDNCSVQVPVGKDVAIVLSGRLENSELLEKMNLQLVNLVLTPTTGKEKTRDLTDNCEKLPTENRVLTPSKYRTSSGRDFGTQTDVEIDDPIKDISAKELKDTSNNNRRDIEKSTNACQMEEVPSKNLFKAKTRTRQSLESRPRWNANRPGTRYRTQSEKDPHYQKRLHLKKRRALESTDEGSRSPSPEQRKRINKVKSKGRNSIIRRNLKDDLSMDAFGSVLPLRIDCDGKILVEDGTNNRPIVTVKKNNNTWCERGILEKLATLKNGLLMKRMEWEDPDRSLSSPTLLSESLYS